MIRMHDDGWYIAMPEPRPTFAPLETADQAAFVRWLRAEGIPVHSVPNSAATNRDRGAAMKREGLLRGVSDLVVFPGDGYVLYVEMKRANGGMGDLSPDQREWLAFVARYGLVGAACWGLTAAQEFIRSRVWERA